MKRIRVQNKDLSVEACSIYRLWNVGTCREFVGSCILVDRIV